VLVDVVRTDGEVAYTGQLIRAEGSIRFSMRDVAREGTAPTNVEGRHPAVQHPSRAG
jgi:hypothetical protein